MGSFLKRTLAAFSVFAGIPVAFGLLMSAAERWASNMVYQAFSWTGIVLTGVVGTPVHELGHYLSCRLFGLPVTEVALFRPVEGRADGILGYVRFVCDSADPWQRLFGFFAGVAPMFFGAGVILLLVFLLTPEVWSSAASSLGAAARRRGGPARMLGALLSGSVKGFGSLRRFGIVRGFLCLSLVCSISMHMSLSVPDLQGLGEGLLFLLLLSALFSLATLLLRKNPQKGLSRMAAVLVVFFSLGLGLCLFFGLLARVAMEL